MKKILIATVAIFVAWAVMDYIIHGIILASAYAATPDLWRPQAEMKMVVMYVSTLISAFAFVMIFSQFITNKGTNTGLRYGLWFGIAIGVSMGYGSYSVMPIPYIMAFTWFLGSVLELGVAGLIVGAIIKE